MLVRVVNLYNMKADLSQINSIAVKVLLEKTGDPDDPDSVLIILTSLIKGGVNKIAVDMSSYSVIDSRSIGALIHASKLIREHHGDMILYQIPEQIMEILKPVNLHRYMKMFTSENEAFDYLGTL